jgi:hypothetical protein
MAGITSHANRVLGRGEVHFAPFADSEAQIAGGFRYLGNSPMFGMTTATQMLEHFSMDHGIKQRDQSIPLEITRTATLELDNIDFANLAYLFFGDSSEVVTVGGSVAGENVNNGAGVTLGLEYYLGVTAQSPFGAGALTFHTGSSAPYTVVTNVGASTTYVEGTDYAVDIVRGTITPLIGGAITAGEALLANYKTTGGTVVQTISGSTPLEGQIRYLADNPAGANIDYLFTWVKLTPDGEFALKGDTWQVIKFKIEILLPTDGVRQAMYANGLPFTS